jgi:alkaline phosphatase
MEIKEKDTLLIILIIGLLLLGNVGSAAAVQFDLNNDINFTNSTNCNFSLTSEAKIKNVIVLIPGGCSQSVETLAR